MPRKKSKAQGLTPLELKIMQVLWDKGPSTVQLVRDNLSEELAYTTVQTVLNVLHRKGRVKRILEGRAHVYKPANRRDAVLGQALQDFIDRMFLGSSEELVMSLLKGRHIDRERLSELAKVVEANEDEESD